MNTRDSQLNPSNIVATAILALVLLMSGVVWLEAFYHFNEEREVARKVIKPPVEEVVDYQREQNELLGSYRFIDKEQGVVGLPIERAMELVVREKGGRGR